MIKIIGDVHGKTGDYKRLVRDMPEGQRSIQIGDMGVGFSGVVVHNMSQDHKWFRGNHDCPEKCRKHPNYLGDYGFLPDDNLFWLAGAFSIDRMYRTIDVSWWQDEELSYAELQEAIALYEKEKPKYVISHEAPENAAKFMLMALQGAYFAAKLECSMSRTSRALQAMLGVHQPDEWVFGHYHLDKTFYLPNCKTKFTCVAELSTYDLETKNEKDNGQTTSERV
jgi:calcineurin-like phosphoesterase family protein